MEEQTDQHLRQQQLFRGPWRLRECPSKGQALCCNQSLPSPSLLTGGRPGWVVVVTIGGMESEESGAHGCAGVEEESGGELLVDGHSLAQLDGLVRRKRRQPPHRSHQRRQDRCKSREKGFIPGKRELVVSLVVHS